MIEINTIKVGDTIEVDLSGWNESQRLNSQHRNHEGVHTITFTHVHEMPVAPSGVYQHPNRVTATCSCGGQWTFPDSGDDEEEEAISRAADDLAAQEADRRMHQ